METKARYVLVGACSLLAIALAFGLLMFSIKHGDKDKLAYYAIDFSGSVAGLSIGNDVRFNGIRVGEVRSFTIDQHDPSQVRVVISVHPDTPIRQDSEASLNILGITGLAVVDITGGSASSPKLPKGDMDEMSVIRSRRSTLGSMLDEAPNLVLRAVELLDRGSNMLSPENQAHLASILESMAVVSATLADQSDNMAITIENLAQASASLNNVLAKADKVIGIDLDKGVNYFSDAFERLDSMLAEMEPGARRLTGATADELMRVMNEAQVVLRNMNELLNSLNSDPQRFFFGDNVPAIRMK